MKRILMISSLIVVSYTGAMAQTQAKAQANATAGNVATARPTLSKNDFVAKTTQLKTLLDANNADGAKAKWAEVHQMLMTELNITKHKIFEGGEANKTHNTDVMIQQRDIYMALIKMKDDLITNKLAINDKLSAFAATMN